MKSNSTGVVLPKMLRSTFTLPFSGLISSTLPGEIGKRPFDHLDVVPFVKPDLGLYLPFPFLDRRDDVLDLLVGKGVGFMP